MTSPSPRSTTSRGRGASPTDEVLPAITDYWERAELRWELIRRLGELGLVGDGIEGWLCRCLLLRDERPRPARLEPFYASPRRVRGSVWSSRPRRFAARTIGSRDERGPVGKPIADQ